MNKSRDFDFEAALQLEPAYQPSERFFEAFYIFASRLGSLQRYFEFSSQYIEAYLAQSSESLAKVRDHSTSAEYFVFHYELTSSDEDYFAEYLRASVLSHLFTLIEGLLADVADDVAKILRQPVNLPSKPMPYINKYVTYLQHGCGLSMDIDKETWRTLDALRELRNRYVHRLNRDLPAQIQQQLQKLVEAAQKPETEVNNLFVRTAFSTIGRLAAEVDAAYWLFVASQEGPKPEST
jgi:hypothetical protein